MLSVFSSQQAFGTVSLCVNQQYYCRNLRHHVTLTELLLGNLPLSPAYPASLLSTNGGAVAQHVRIYVATHHDNQGYRFTINGCQVQQQGKNLLLLIKLSNTYVRTMK